jgi:hypothetical protein
MFTVLPPSSSQSMIGTFVPYEVIEEIFSKDEDFEKMDEKIQQNMSAYFIEHNGLIYKFSENHLELTAYFVGFLIDGTLEFDDEGNMKTCVDIKKLKVLLSNIGVSSPKITYHFA